MSRPQKIHKPIKGGFNESLAAIAIGQGKSKRVARKFALKKQSAKPPKKK